jgi:alkaline phosphatase D
MAEIEFAHGVASGDPTKDGIVLWTRATPSVDGSDGVTLGWRIWSDGDGREVGSGRVAASPETDHTAKVVVDGLEPGTRYRYQFASTGSESPVGRFRTLPVAADEIRIGVFACAKYNAGVFNVYRQLARLDLDVALCLGDYIYEAANVPPASQTPGADIGRDFDPLDECRTLEQYRRRYAQYHRDPDVQALHQAHAVAATIDDHELADNAWSGGAEEHRPEEHGPWADRMAGALRAWQEWTPTRATPADGGPIYRALDVGSLCRIAMIETRTHRSAPSEPDPALRSELGTAQLAWLRDIVANAAEPWVFLAVPSAIAPLWSPELDEDASFALRKLKLVEPKDGTPFHDLWDSFPGERRELMEILRSSTAHPVVLSGDVHVGLDSELREDGELIAHEWTTSSVTSQNLDDKMGWARRAQSPHYEERVLAALPHLRWCDFDSHGYVVVNVQADQVDCEWWAVAEVLRATDDQESIHQCTIDSRARG